jgi:hypothetical protein
VGCRGSPQIGIACKTRQNPKLCDDTKNCVHDFLGVTFAIEFLPHKVIAYSGKIGLNDFSTNIRINCIIHSYRGIKKKARKFVEKRQKSCVYIFS